MMDATATMKVSACFGFAVAAVFSAMVVAEARLQHVPLGSIAEARLRHVPLGRRVGDLHRSLAEADDDVDQDNLYQARGVQYADLKVGASRRAASSSLLLLRVDEEVLVAVSVSLRVALFVSRLFLCLILFRMPCSAAERHH